MAREDSGRSGDASGPRGGSTSDTLDRIVASVPSLREAGLDEVADSILLMANDVKAERDAASPPKAAARRAASKSRTKGASAQRAPKTGTVRPASQQSSPGTTMSQTQATASASQGLPETAMFPPQAAASASQGSADTAMFPPQATASVSQQGSPGTTMFPPQATAPGAPAVSGAPAARDASVPPRREPPWAAGSWRLGLSSAILVVLAGAGHASNHMDRHIRSLRWVMLRRRDLVLRTLAAATMTLLVAWAATRI